MSLPLARRSPIRTARRLPRRWPLAVALLLALAACGEAPEASGDDSDALPTDTTLAAVLLDLHLADARAETTGEPLDSLRQVAFAQHATDSARVAQGVREHSTTPEAVSALYGAVQDLFSRPP